MKASTRLFVALVFAASAAHAGDSELAIGAPGPDFKLRGTDGKTHSLDSYLEESKAVVVVFTCNSCPFSKAYEPVLIDLAEKYADDPVSIVLINSNDVKIKPTDSFEHMVERAKEKKFPFPYLYDESQEVAHAYGARVTPHVFVLNDEKICVYRGRVDDNANRDKVKMYDLANALDALLAGEEIPVATTKAFGCSIKWKKTSS